VKLSPRGVRLFGRVAVWAEITVISSVSTDAMRSSCFVAALFLGMAASVPAADSNDISEWIETIRRVDHYGDGNEAAREAVARLGKLPADQLPVVREAFRGANPISRNYLRNAAEQIYAANRPGVSVESLRQFVTDREQDPQARRMAYEWIEERDAGAASKLVDEFLDDPSEELRRAAVATKMEEAESLLQAGQDQKAIAAYREALSGAVHEDQVKEIVAALADADVEVDIAEHFGFLTEWQVAGPFDNTEMRGFDTAYPPEQSVDLSATYGGKLGEVGWQVIATDDDFGVLDIGKQLEIGRAHV